MPMATVKNTALVLTLALFAVGALMVSNAKGEDIDRSDALWVQFPCDGSARVSPLFTPGQNIVVHDIETTVVVFGPNGLPMAPRSVDGIGGVVRNGTAEFATNGITARYYVPAYSRPVPDTKQYHWERYAPHVLASESLQAVGSCFPPGVSGFVI